MMKDGRRGQNEQSGFESVKHTLRGIRALTSESLAAMSRGVDGFSCEIGLFTRPVDYAGNFPCSFGHPVNIQRHFFGVCEDTFWILTLISSVAAAMEFILPGSDHPQELFYQSCKEGIQPQQNRPDLIEKFFLRFFNGLRLPLQLQLQAVGPRIGVRVAGEKGMIIAEGCQLAQG